MQYLHDMLNKNGFRDGACMPHGSRVYRRLYVQTMNALLEDEGSTVRVIAYNRSGLHNPCMIELVTVRCFVTLDTPTTVLEGTQRPPHIVYAEPDDAYWRAEERAQDLGVDEYVTVTVLVNEDGLTDLLAQVVEDA